MIAIHTVHGTLHLEIQTSRKSPVGLHRTTFRENKKMKHSQHGCITDCSLEQLKLLQLFFREQVLPSDARMHFKSLIAENMAQVIQYYRLLNRSTCRDIGFTFGLVGEQRVGDD